MSAWRVSVSLMYAADLELSLGLSNLLRPLMFVSAVAGAADLLGNRIFSTWCRLGKKQAQGG